jgi:hypothetical protein
VATISATLHPASSPDGIALAPIAIVMSGLMRIRQ